MAEGNSLGVSTGINQGEAQVFGDTYNPFFKEKLTEAKEKKAGLDKDVSTFQSKGVYWRDAGLMKEKLGDYRSFVQNNVQALMDGDFDAISKKNQMESDMTQFVSNSKAAELWDTTASKMIDKNPEKYAVESKQALQDFRSKPGTWGTTSLEASYTAKPTIDSIMKYANDQGYSPSALSTENLADADFLKQFKSQRSSGIKNYIKSLKDDDMAMYPLQASKYWTPEREEELYNSAIAQLDSEMTAKQISRPSDDSDGSSIENTPQLLESSTITGITPYNMGSGFFGDDKVSGNNSKFNTSYSLPLNKGKVRLNASIVKNGGIPLKGEWARYTLKDGKKVPEKASASVGADYNLDKIRDLMASDNEPYEVSEIFFADAFADDAKGEQSDKDISGFLVPADYTPTEKQPIEKRFYVRMINPDNNKVIVVPFKNIQNNLKAGLRKGDYEDIITKYKNLAQGNPELAKALKKDMLGFSSSSVDVKPATSADIYTYNGVEYTVEDLKAKYGDKWKEAASKLQKKQ